MTSCNTCEFESREMWGPNKRHDFALVKKGNWICLERCDKCGTLWVYSPYEPYSSFPYWVKWRKTPEEWEQLHQIDIGHSMLNWHMKQIREIWISLPSAEKEFIEAHRKRTRGHHNPIDLPLDEKIDLSSFLT